MRKEIKRISINCLGKYYELNFLKIFKPGQIIYDLVTIVDSETNKLAFTNQKLNEVILNTRESSPELLTLNMKNLPKELILAIKNGIMSEYYNRSNP